MFRILLIMLGLSLTQPALAETRVPQSQSEISLGFAPLVKAAAPAVVNIYAKIVTQGYDSPFAGDPFFRDFFKGFGTPRQRVQNSLGSGVILSSDGIVVSNYHVVAEATEIRVATNDRKEYDAKVVLADKAADLAILQLQGAQDLPHLTLRNSDRVEVGELVLAIGNPFGVGQTVSSGIVSGLARTGGASGGGLGYFIQTDAPINPGNSGGALIDVNGDLIGINSRILSRSGGSNGIGFAIPANLVAQFVKQAQAGEQSFQRPWAGMAGQPVDSDLAHSLGLDLPEGIVISDLHPDSPFAKAGFRVGDVITQVDGLPVNSAPEMVFRMTVTGIGETAKFTRVRDGQPEEIAVRMIPAPNKPAAEPITLGDKTVLPGLSVARINPAVITRVDLPLSAEGVVITDPGRYGARAGLRPGDVIVSINDVAISRTGDVKKALTDPGRWLKMDLLRHGQQVSLRFRL
ncbi:trypsin-like peptidase domain-containing protein [Pseudodonghicola flavimaris]|uniref:Trypsin-like peptidase domain-containing protein n=1 Tax=Pseudodonghicola flavimaris TaxID=3050036 RepID=A0ABT7F268_9RHOB|nr:trypsin-like peptidase domain-containing protein [Pseudodonghicola flavimaris]MDK3018696.1 trypsin-like peptidase domain-containing protein [Pseudodonghicola flavimaris]